VRWVPICDLLRECQVACARDVSQATLRAQGKDCQRGDWVWHQDSCRSISAGNDASLGFARSLPRDPRHRWGPVRMAAAIADFHEQFKAEVQTVTLQYLGLAALLPAAIDTAAWDEIARNNVVYFELGFHASCAVGGGHPADYRHLTLKQVRAVTMEQAFGNDQETIRLVLGLMGQGSFVNVAMVTSGASAGPLSVLHVEHCRMSPLSRMGFGRLVGLKPRQGPTLLHDAVSAGTGMVSC
jgi:hypothetical protein